MLLLICVCGGEKSKLGKNNGGGGGDDLVRGKIESKNNNYEDAEV